MKNLLRFSNLSFRSVEGGAFYTPILKSVINHYKEYWYIGSIVDKSMIQKNSNEALNATGLYDSLASSI